MSLKVQYSVKNQAFQFHIHLILSILHYNFILFLPILHIFCNVASSFHRYLMSLGISEQFLYILLKDYSFIILFTIIL